MDFSSLTKVADGIENKCLVAVAGVHPTGEAFIFISLTSPNSSTILHVVS